MNKKTQFNNITTISDEELIRELRQSIKRKEYMSSPEAKEKRKAYMKERYAKIKAAREALKKLKETDPAKYEELMHKASGK